MNPIWFFIGWLGLGIIFTLIAMFFKSLGMSEKKSNNITSSIVVIPVLAIVVIIFLGSIFLFPAMFIKEFWLNDCKSQTTYYYNYYYDYTFQHTSGCARSDESEVGSYRIKDSEWEYISNEDD